MMEKLRGRPSGSFGQCATAMLAAIEAQPPRSVQAIAHALQISRACAKYTASRLVGRGLARYDRPVTPTGPNRRAANLVPVASGADSTAHDVIATLSRWPAIGCIGTE